MKAFSFFLLSCQSMRGYTRHVSRKSVSKAKIRWYAFDEKGAFDRVMASSWALGWVNRSKGSVVILEKKISRSDSEQLLIELIWSRQYISSTHAKLFVASRESLFPFPDTQILDKLFISCTLFTVLWSLSLSIVLLDSPAQHCVLSERHKGFDDSFPLLIKCSLASCF